MPEPFVTHLDYANEHNSRARHGQVAAAGNESIYTATHEVPNGGTTNHVSVQVTYAGEKGRFNVTIIARPSQTGHSSSLANNASVKYELKSGHIIGKPKIAGEKLMKGWPGLNDAVQKIADEHATRAWQVFNQFRNR